MGQTRIVLGEETTLAFAMHDEGYIELAPCTPFVRALKITHTAGSNEIISEAGFKKYMEGQYLYLDGWKKIRQVAGTDQATCLNLPTEAARRIRPL
ncbi:MAG: hypothetical protein Q4E13_00635 [Clostridia bacterium]|nr:hypothetical protein [Clostridia bacterium]